ncbi:MAG: hypothetical protein ACK57P_14435 [Planctomycetota bacterium]
MLNKWKLSHPVLERLRWIVHIVGVLMMGTLGYLGWHVRESIQSWHSRMEYEVQQDSELLENTARIESQLDEAMQDRDQISASFRRLRDRVPVRLVDSDILGELEKVVAVSHCKLNDFRPMGNQTIDTKDLKCKVRSFQLSLNASYAGLFAFARSLEDFPFLVYLKKLRLITPTANKKGCTIDLELGILFAPEWSESELVSVART